MAEIGVEIAEIGVEMAEKKAEWHFLGTSKLPFYLKPGITTLQFLAYSVGSCFPVLHSWHLAMISVHKFHGAQFGLLIGLPNTCLELMAVLQRRITKLLDFEKLHFSNSRVSVFQAAPS